MSKIKIADLRVLTPRRQEFSTPLFLWEVKRPNDWKPLCSPEFAGPGVTREFKLMFKGALRTAWARGQAFDSRNINQRVTDQIDWAGSPPVTIFGDVIVEMPTKHWPYTLIGNDSSHARDVLAQVGREGVAVLSTRYMGGQTACLLAAKTEKDLAIAKLAAG